MLLRALVTCPMGDGKEIVCVCFVLIYRKRYEVARFLSAVNIYWRMMLCCRQHGCFMVDRNRFQLFANKCGGTVLTAGLNA